MPLPEFTDDCIPQQPDDVPGAIDRARAVEAEYELYVQHHRSNAERVIREIHDMRCALPEGDDWGYESPLLDAIDSLREVFQ